MTRGDFVRSNPVGVGALDDPFIVYRKTMLCAHKSVNFISLLL